MTRPSKDRRFTRASRLASKADFQFVFADPIKISRRGLLVLYRNSGRSQPRLGMVISKQQIKRAVDRNRLRRVIRESFRQAQVDLPALDIVLLIKSTWAALSLSDCRIELATIWLKLKGER